MLSRELLNLGTVGCLSLYPAGRQCGGLRILNVQLVSEVRAVLEGAVTFTCDPLSDLCSMEVNIHEALGLVPGPETLCRNS